MPVVLLSRGGKESDTRHTKMATIFNVHDIDNDLDLWDHIILLKYY